MRVVAVSVKHLANLLAKHLAQWATKVAKELKRKVSKNNRAPEVLEATSDTSGKRSNRP